MNVDADAVQEAIAENARVAQNQEEYSIRYEALSARFQETKDKYDAVTAEITQRGIRRREFGRFIHSLEALPDMVTEFSEELWGSLVDHVTVYSKDNIVFTLTSGMEIKASDRQGLRRFTFGWGAYFFWLLGMECGIINETNSATYELLSKEAVMLQNNIELDVKSKCIEEKVSQHQVAENIGTSGTYISRLINHPEKIVNKTFLAMMEDLGYDVRLTYEKRDTAE